MSQPNPSKNQHLLEQLDVKIKLLAEEVKLYAHVKLNKSCFDEQLFKSPLPTSGYQPYFAEIEYNFKQLSKLINAVDSHIHLDQISYLSELIVNQLVALKRELATHELHNQDKSFQYETIYEKHARNLDYLRRLENIKYELTLSGDDFNKQKLLATEQRIERCKYAISVIEQQIEAKNHRRH